MDSELKKVKHTTAHVTARYIDLLDSLSTKRDNWKRFQKIHLSYFEFKLIR